MNRLTKTFEKTDTTHLDDYLTCLMATIEDALLQSGFKPMDDYTPKDLIAFAMPLLLDAWHAGKLTFTVGWPMDGDTPAVACPEARIRRQLYHG
jgi:hypothetical protein